MLEVMIILGIESSCDETAAAVVEDGYRLLSNVVASSMDLHAVYGGVVPEIAARSHIEAITGVIEQAFEQAECTWDDIDAIAVTYGAGLGGSLLIGVLTARTLAITHNKPLYACNHVEGHVYANFLTEVKKIRALSDYKLPPTQPTFPLLALIVSGGHSQLVLFQDHFDYVLLGQTQDDAIGEAYDKVAKILGLPYPGGPSVGKKALEGDPHAFTFPKARMTSVSPALESLRGESSKTANPVARALSASSAGDRRWGSAGQNERSDVLPEEGRAPLDQSVLQMGATPHAHFKPPLSYDFSFSGLKTAVLRTAQELIGEDHTFPSKNLPERLLEPQKADIAASFQRVATETVVDKALQAYEEFQPASVVIAGGVAASPELRRQLAERLPCPINYTDPRLCTDNGAMIATLGCFHMKLGRPPADPYTLDIRPNLSM
jgi:N6-L-threonylcarbamoyladenine synthase